MRLTICVVSYDARDLVLACLRSVAVAAAAAAVSPEVIVVDNGSRDGTAAAVRAAHPAVRVVEAGENLGFAAGVNRAAAEATGDWILLLNNDAQLAPDALCALLPVAERAAGDVGSIALLMRFVGNGRINSAGLDVDRLGVAFDRLIGADPAAAGTAVTEVFGASGGAALIRRRTFDELGGLDPTFFLYLEDVDLAWRARMRGWRCLLVPTAVVHHHHSASTGHASAFKHRHVGRNRVRLLAKNMPRGELLRRAPAIVGYELAYVAVAVLRDRSAAPVLGRLSGLRQWRRYRQAGAGRRPVELAPVQGLRGARRRAGAVAASAMQGPDAPPGGDERTPLPPAVTS